MGAGGSERVISLLANRWVQGGGRVAIVTFEAVGQRPYYFIDPRIELFQLGIEPVPRPWWKASTQTARRVYALRRTFRRICPDVVISFLTKTNVMSVLAAWRLGIPIIISERNNPALQHFNKTWTLARSSIYPKAFGLVTITRGALEYFPQELRKRAWVIPNMVDFPPMARRRSTGRNLTAVGRLVDQKGFDLLIQAFAKIAADFPEWSLTIWGEGPERKDLEAMRDRLGLSARIQLPGVSSNPGEWTEKADIFVLSSRYEGWGNVLLEAMASGLPVVSYDCDWGPAEMITDGLNGLLVPPGDVDALSRSLARLMSDQELRNLLAKNAAEVSSAFSVERISAQWCAVAEHAIASRQIDLRHA